MRIIIMISCILGCTSGEFVDEVIMAFLSIFTLGKPSAILYDYGHFTVGRMHEHLTRLPTKRVFKYSSVLFHMFLYYQIDKFPLKIEKLDTKGKEILVIFWTSLVHKFSTSYKYFRDSFAYPVMNMLTTKTRLRINPKIKRVLHLAKNSKVGDQYLYQNHTEIGIYGCDLSPYKLPKCLLMRIFSLEYFRQIISVNEVNFLVVIKKTQFKMKNQMDPFICNTREAGPEADKMLQELKFKNIFTWHYDRHGVINKLRQKVKLGPYIHYPGPDIEQYVKQSEWVENMLIDMDSIVVDVENIMIDLEKQFYQSSFPQVLELGEPMNIPPIIQTPLNEDKNPKRNREEASSSAMETTDEKFKLNKRPKLNLVSE